MEQVENVERAAIMDLNDIAWANDLLNHNPTGIESLLLKMVIEIASAHYRAVGGKHEGT